MMEPGDLADLVRLAETTGAGLGAPSAFEALLPRYEVFVAEIEPGRIAGFAAAAPLSSLVGADEGEGSEGAEGCFWIGALAVAPSCRRLGLGTALLGAVTARAHWFFCRALGLSVVSGSPDARFLERRGFLAISPADLTSALRKRLGAECSQGVPPEERRAMIRWL